jgi:hypothetical protein
MADRFLESIFTQADHLAVQRTCFVLSYIGDTALIFLTQCFIRKMKLISKKSFKTQLGLFSVYIAYGGRQSAICFERSCCHL